MKSLRLAPLLIRAALGLAIVSGCRTTGGSELQSAAASGLADNLTLAKDDGQALYLLMISVELNGGIKVPKDQQHGVRGVGHCRKDMEPETCQVFVRLPDGALGAPQPLSGDLTDKLASFVKTSRPQLEKETVYLVELSCDYLGKKSPPYDVEDVVCTATQARSTREAVFDEPVAIELADGLRSDARVGDKVATLVGSLACRFAEGSNRAACMIRSMNNGVLGEKVLEVGSKNAPAVAKKMMEAAVDIRTLGAETKENPGAGVRPKEMAGALVCVVDGSKAGADGGGARRYHCRVTL